MLSISVVFLNTSVLSADNDTPKPYKLESLTGQDVDFYKFKSSYRATHQIDTTEVFNRFTACYPAKSNFDVEVKLQTGFKSYNSDTTGQDKFYGGIVATMPLFSANENERLRNQEYKRRQELSKLIASLVGVVTKRNLAVRKIALFESLERREQLRVKTGLVPVSEQVSYLEKLANEYQKRYEAIADIDSVRLQLVSHCVVSKADILNIWLLNQIHKI